MQFATCKLMAIFQIVCDKYDYQSWIRRQTYLGRHFLAKTNTIIFGLKCYGKKQIQIYLDPIFFFTNTNANILGFTKMGEFEYEYDYSDWYLRIWIRLRILSHKKII